MAEKEKKEKKEGSKGNILRIVIIVLLVAILVAGGVAAGYIFASKARPAANNNNNINNSNGSQTVLNQKTFSLEDFLLNVKGDANNPGAYLKAKIYIGYADTKDNKKLPTELEDKKAILRDCVNSVLRSKKANDFNDDNVPKLKKEIKEKINPMLQNGRIEDVYFYEIIVQAQ